jgi:hypothetical protein
MNTSFDSVAVAISINCFASLTPSIPDSSTTISEPFAISFLPNKYEATVFASIFVEASSSAAALAVGPRSVTFLPSS